MRSLSFAESKDVNLSNRRSESERNPLNKLPGHLKKIGKNEIHKRDVFGRTLLHICILSNDVTSLRQVLQNGESKKILSATDHENGWNILHYIFFHKRLRCFNVLMSILDTNNGAVSPILKDLLKRKDRSGVTPLSLLQNDAKDLFWIPQYINEKNKFHLVRRFMESGADSGGSGDGGNSVVSVTESHRSQSSTGTTTPRNTKSIRNPLRDLKHDWWCETRGGSDVLVLGSNANNNLGVGDSHDRSEPVKICSPESKASESLVGLRKILEIPRFKLMRMSKYHSVLCSTDNRVYTCGIGSRGRLGLGNASTSDRFKEVTISKDNLAISDCATSNNHTVILTKAGSLYAWGLNSLNQLGFTSSASQNSFKTITEAYENTPREIATGDLRRSATEIRGVAVSDIHSIAFASHTLYFWGLNIGQIGAFESEELTDHRVNEKTYKGFIVRQPKEIPMRDEIKLVTTCETATAVVTTTNEIYLFHQGQRVKLPKIQPRVSAEAHFDYFKPTSLTSAPSIKKVAMKSHKTVHVLLESGDVMTFGVSSNDIKSLRSIRYSVSWSAHELSMRVVDIENSTDGSLLVCTRNGSVYIKSSSNTTSSRRGSSTSNLTGFSPFVKKKFKKIEGLNRVSRVACNDNFTSFAFLRDDIDSLPFKLQKNDFFEDMEYLSPFIESDMYRKQDQLLDTDHDMNCYVSDFLYPSPSTCKSKKNDLFMLNRLKTASGPHDDNRYNECKDLLEKRYLVKYCSEKNKKPSTDVVFQKLSTRMLEDRLSSLKLGAMNNSFDCIEEWQRDKFCDGKIEFAYSAGLNIGFHTDVFRKRSRLCQKVFSPQEEGEYLVHQHIEGAYDPTSRTIRFRTKIEPMAVLILVYFMYTNTVLEVWQNFKNDDPGVDGVRKVKSDFLALLTLFKMETTLGKNNAYLEQFQDWTKDDSSDVIISLSDGEIVRCSSSIVSRSAFFETILSGRWDSSKTEGETGKDEDVNEVKYVGLEEVSLIQMKVILSHLQGCHDLHVFDEALYSVCESWDSDDFVNFLLEMIEIADELLLVQLKHICELAISEFVNIDNVLALLSHAEWNGAEKLFMACCWYVYNNLDLVLFDKELHHLDNRILEALEVQVQFLDKCKHPHLVVGSRGDINREVFLHESSKKESFSVIGFLDNTARFNELFMSDAKGFSSFEPLVDVRKDMSVSGQERRMSSTHGMTRRDSGDILSEVRRLSLTSTADNTNNLVSIEKNRGSYSGSMENESAILEEEDFEVVGSRKRKPKSRNSSLKVTTPQPGEPGPSNEKSNKTEPISSKLTTTNGIENRRGSSTSRKVSTSSGSGPILGVNPGPALGPALGETLNQGKKQTKIKFAPVAKLSQKERRRLRDGSVDTMSHNHFSESTESSQSFRNPWSIQKSEEGTSARQEKKTNGKLNALPVLGQKESPAPKLSAIILEETTRLAEEKEPVVTQTLQEIQQEQEFAKWWEKECKRVQQQESSRGNLTSRKKSHTPSSRNESKRGAKSGRGRGGRGGS